MSFPRSFVYGLGLAAALVTSALAATHPRVNVQPQARIFRKIDNADLTPRPHTTVARIAAATDQGRVAANTQFNHMMLVLKSTDEQEFALTGLLDQQQDKSSPNYHQWMTPDTFGATFGVAASDLAQITAWLQDSGFTLEQVTKGARIIQFSGTSAQVEAAFHTEMHNYLLNGETHVANSTDISIPNALSSVVVGVASLNNFSPRNHMLNARNVVRGTDGQMYPVIPGTTTPDYTSATSGAHYVGAGDIATIFNTKPLLAAGVDGTGVNIGIIGQTDILLSDIQIYRSLFNLPKNDPTFTLIGSDPGTIPDDGESDLDVELSGGTAPGASINFVYSGNSYFGGGIDAAGVYLVENNNADILSLSYGECEANLSASGNAFYNTLWQQAAAQGQTVFVSSGDSGPATCDGSTASYETHGYNVNGLASTPYNVAVGGTQFNEGTTTGVTPYWGPAAGAPYSTALGYIPEAPLDESKFGDNSWPGQTIFSGGSGISFYYPSPSFQAGPGVPAADPTPNAGTISASSFVVPGPHRYLPDVSLISSVYHDSTVYCSEGSCKLNADGTVAGLGLVGGTSVAAPTMAGVQALINQKNGGRQGNANFYYYRVAAAQSQTNCISATYVTTAGCGFHDGQVGTNNIPSNAAAGTYIGWSAGPGYDLAIGLGSPDVYNLATAWSTVSFNATTTSLTLTPTAGITHGATQTVTVAVSPISGTGTPTGNVSIIAGAAYGGVGFYTLSNGSASGTLTGLPAGTYNVYAHYAGDTTYGGSNSAPVSVTISPESSILTAHAYLLSTNGSLSAASSYTYGANVYLDAQVAGASNTGTPTGTVTFALTHGTTSLAPFLNHLDSFADTYFDAGLGLAAYDIMPTAPVLPPGTYIAAISYSGDTSFNASTATPITFTITPANQALVLRAVSTEITSGATAIFNASIATISPAAGGVPATGAVTFTDTTANTVLGTGTLTSGAVVFTTTAITTTGTHTITATYAGDPNYLTKTAAVTLTVGGASSTIGLTSSTMSAPVGTTVTLTATLPTGATGTVFFYDNGVSLGGATISTTTLTAALSLSTLTAGTHTITATSSGNSTQATATSTTVLLTITKNNPTVQLTAQQNNASASTVAMNAIVLPSPRGSSGNNPPPTGLVQFLDGTALLGTATPTYLPGGYNNYVAAFTTQALKPGPHTLTATYLGDSNFNTGTSNAQTVNIGLTTPTLTASTTSVGTGIPFTLTDQITPKVASTAPVSGTVTFYDGSTSLGTAKVTNGVATLTTAVLVGVGPHSVTAIYSGDTNFYASTTAATSITVVQTTATPLLTVSAGTIQVGTGVTLTATTPTYSTGTVTFLDNGASLGSATLTGTTPTATLTVTSFTARTHTLTATYNGDTNFLTGNSTPTLLTVTRNTPTLVLAPLPNAPTTLALTLSATLIPAPAGAKPNNPPPTGSIQYTDGTTILGLAPVVPLTDGSGNYAAPFTTPVLQPGPRSISASYLGDTNYTATTSTAQTVSLGLTTTTLTSSASSVGLGTPFQLTAKIASALPASVPIGGSVTFSDGATLLGTAAVTAGVATITPALTASATHTLTALYSGDTNFYTSTAPAITITTVTPGVAVAINPGSLTLTRGSSGSAILSVTTTGNYSGTITPTCTGLPAASACAFSPTPLLVNGSNGTQTTIVTITTAAPTKTSGFLWFPAFVLAAFVAVRRKQLTVRSRHLLVLAVIVCGMLAVTGCGSPAPTNLTPTGGTPTGNSTVTITLSAVGSTSASPSVQPNATLALTVQ